MIRVDLVYGSKPLVAGSWLLRESSESAPVSSRHSRLVIGQNRRGIMSTYGITTWAACRVSWITAHNTGPELSISMRLGLFCRLLICTWLIVVSGWKIQRGTRQGCHQLQPNRLTLREKQAPQVGWLLLFVRLLSLIRYRIFCLVFTYRFNKLKYNITLPAADLQMCK